MANGSKSGKAGKPSKEAKAAAKAARKQASKERRTQLWQAFQMQRKEDKRLLPYMIGAFVLITGAAVAAGVFVGGFTMYMLIPLGVVLMMFSLAGIPPLAGWFAKFVMFRSIIDAASAAVSRKFPSAGPNGSIQGPCEAKWGYTTLSVADWDADGDQDLPHGTGDALLVDRRGHRHHRSRLCVDRLTVVEVEGRHREGRAEADLCAHDMNLCMREHRPDRKSTRLNSSH